MAALKSTPVSLPPSPGPLHSNLALALGNAKYKYRHFLHFHGKKREARPCLLHKFVFSTLRSQGSMMAQLVEHSPCNK